MYRIKINLQKKAYFFIIFLFLFNSCKRENLTEAPPEPDPEPEVFRIPVVVHIIHKGEPVGERFNLSYERIERQIEILNEDYRRKEGTRGFNNHPDGVDTKIEFILAKTDPDGNPTNGIVRVNSDSIDNPVPLDSSRFDYYAFYSYWNYKYYLNIWTLPLHESTIDIFLGEATGPDTDLPGAESFLAGEPIQAEGIHINSFHFGESEIQSDYNLGRTLTHEVGHYLGLLHLWGRGDCENNDYCDDTPPVDKHTSGCPAIPPLACNGEPAMIENFMDWSADACMNLFTNDQVERMHYVLKNSPHRKSLLTSPGLKKR